MLAECFLYALKTVPLRGHARFEDFFQISSDVSRTRCGYGRRRWTRSAVTHRSGAGEVRKE